MISEREVLGGVENFKQRRSGIAAEVHSKLVYFVEHHHRVVDTRTPKRLNDAARHRTDVRPPVTSKLSLIAHASKRHAFKLAAHRSGDRLTEAGLADAGRSDEAQYRRLGRRVQLYHCKVLEYALLYVLQIVVIFVEHDL